AGERCVHGAAGGGTAALCGRRAGAYARFPVRPPHTPAGLRARENRSRRARPRRARVRGHARARTRRAAAMALHGRLQRARALGGRLRTGSRCIDRCLGAVSGDGAMKEALAAPPGEPLDDSGPVFREPWEAQAFAMTLALYERGLFTWPQWAATLAAEIKRAQATGDPDTGETYYRHWLNALERLIAEKGVTDPQTLERYRNAWDHAA